MSTAQNQADTTPLSRRILALRRAYGRGLRRKPTDAESSAMMRAARLTAMAEAAVAGGACLNDVVRVDRLARIARRDMRELLDAGAKAKRAAASRNLLLPLPTLDGRP